MSGSVPAQFTGSISGVVRPPLRATIAVDVASLTLVTAPDAAADPRLIPISTTSCSGISRAVASKVREMKAPSSVDSTRKVQVAIWKVSEAVSLPAVHQQPHRRPPGEEAEQRIKEEQHGGRQ